MWPVYSWIISFLQSAGLENMLVENGKIKSGQYFNKFCENKYGNKNEQQVYFAGLEDMVANRA